MPEDTQNTIFQLAGRAGKTLSQYGLKLVTAESCTGGGVGQAITDISGSSNWYDRGFITYSNQAKIEMLGISETTLDQHGTVSEQTAKEMLIGALNNSRAQIGVSITGIAGPSGGTEQKPIGMVCFAWGKQDNLMYSETHYFDGDRAAIRHQSIIVALEGIIDLVNQAPPVMA